MDLSERRRSSFRRHPWELARADFFLRLLGRHGLLAGDASWLDAGAGDAWFASRLRQRAPAAATITCWDIHYTAEDLRELEGLALPNVGFVTARPEKAYDRILMLDVLEHVDDDNGFVHAAVRELLRRGGHVLVAVPAYPALWSGHDRRAGHRRRYSPRECLRLLEQAGLDVIASGGLFMSLLPLRLVRVLAERLLGGFGAPSGVGGWRRGAGATAIIAHALGADGRLSLAASDRGYSLPGLSFWALARGRG